MSKSVIQTPDEATTRVFQHEIATRLGLSHATVSMALRDHPRIRAATRERIKRMAEEMGYQPNPSLRIFSNYIRSKRKPSKLSTIGWINAWSQPGKLAKHHEYGGYWKGACEAAAQMGYRLEEFQLHPKTPPSELNRKLRAKNFCGLLLPPEGDPAALSHIPWDRYHVVSLSHYASTPASHLVAPDRFENCALAFKMMRIRGYRRIGFLTDEFPSTINDKLSVAGFFSGQLELPENERLPVFATQDHPLPHQLSEWIDCHRPDAILTDLPDASRLLKRTGLKIPQDLGLAFSCRSQTVTSAGIDCQPEEVGRVSLEILKSVIDGYVNPAFKMRVSVNGRWREGRTLPRRPEGD
jgi:LacI family transcriptional regulator